MIVKDWFYRYELSEYKDFYNGKTNHHKDKVKLVRGYRTFLCNKEKCKDYD